MSTFSNSFILYSINDEYIYRDRQINENNLISYYNYIYDYIIYNEVVFNSLLI